MPIYVASKDLTIEEVRQSLKKLVANFETDAAANRKAIRDIFAANQKLFYTASIEILKTATESRGTQYLVAVMADNGLLAEALCDRTLTRDEALALARIAVRVDGMADATLARNLADSAFGQGDVILDPARIMDILAEVADATRVLPSLMRLLRHSNPYLRSRVVKMIGKGSKSVKWVRTKLAESDPRVRANALEAIWGVDSPEARELLRYAANDASNRVMGNALVGLYFLGDNTVLEELMKLSTRVSALSRATAAWAMGVTGDVRFGDAVRRLLLEKEPVVRKRALSALGGIKQANSACESLPPLHVAARLLPGSRTKATRRVSVSVASEAAKEPPKVAPLHFVLSESGQYVMSYRVVEKAEAETFSVVWVIPRTAEEDFQPFVEGMLTCLRIKRPCDFWCVMPYLESYEAGFAAQLNDLPVAQFSPAPDAIEAQLREPAKKSECGDLWTSVWRATRTEAQAGRGPRHVIVFSRSPESRVAGHGLVGNLQNGKCQVHAVSSVENRELSEFCDRAQAPFNFCTPDEIVHAIRQIYLGFMARYEINYEPMSPNATSLKVRIQAHDGCGETVVPLIEMGRQPAPAGASEAPANTWSS